MYPISQDWLNRLWIPTYQHITMTYTDDQDATQTITEADILENSLVVNRSGSTGSNIQLGSAIMSELDFTLNNATGKYDTAELLGKELYVSLRITYYPSSGGSDTIQCPIGYFTIDEAVRRSTTISVVAFDRMARFDNPATGLATAGTIEGKTAQWVINRICTLCGVVTTYLPVTSQYPANYTTPTITEPDNWTELATENTYRQVLMWVLERCGCIGYISHNGGLVIGQYTETPIGVQPQYMVELTTANRKSSNLAEADITISGFVAKVGDDTYTNGTDTYRLVIDQNPLVDSTNAQTIIDGIGAKLIGYHYRPFTANCMPTPNLHPCDPIYFTEADGTRHLSLVMNWTYRLNGTTTISSTGNIATAKGYASGNQLTKAEQAVVEKLRKATATQLSSIELAGTHMNELAANTLGYYMTEETQQDGSKITYWHDKPTLAASTTIYKRGASGFFLSTDGGTTYTNGFDSSGNAVLNILDAIGIRAEWLQTGLLTDQAGINYWNLQTGAARFSGDIVANSLTLGSGASIPNTKVDGLAAVATSGSYNDLSNKPTIPSLTGYIKTDGKIGSTPASGATGFVVSSAGALTASNAIIWGKLYSSEGTIGGMTLSSNAMYSGTNSMTSTTRGVYVGTAGIRLYGSSSAYFNVTNQGAVTVVGGSITGSTFKSSDGKTQLDGTGLTIRDGATDAASTRKLSIFMTNAEPQMTMYYRANTSAAWSQVGTFLFAATGIKINAGIVNTQYLRINDINIINASGSSVIVRGDYFYTTGGTELLSVSGSNVLVGGKTPVYTSTDQTIGGTKTFSAVPAVKANYPGLDFQTSIGTTMTIIANSGTTNSKYRADRFYFRHYSYNSSSGDRIAHYYQYRLPAVPAGLSSDATYEILTSQSAVSIAQGGTGATSVAGARNALGLGNTSGALPIANGGTGATTVAAARNALGLGNTSGALPIANGGTGQTTAAAARNALGLGNTTGALPIANGGTGQTTAAAARNALGLGNTTGALPVANGGTGATSAAGARSNIGVNQPTVTSVITIAANATGTFSVTTANYMFYCLKFSVGGVATTLFFTREQMLTSAQSYYIDDGTSSAMEVIITRTASSITVKRNGSTACTCTLAYWN